MHLYETHLPVADTEAAKRFYLEVVGATFAHRDLTRDIVFLWIGDDRRSMLGLWGPKTLYGREPHKTHVAFAVTVAELLQAAERLQKRGIATRDFMGRETTEPSVIGWMPSAQIYFTDPDGHELEFIALLDERPNPNFVGSLSEWNASRTRT